MERRMKFIVTLGLGHGDGGDVCVSVDVSDEEYELLKSCCREEADIEGYDGLESLYEEIKEAAQEENESCRAGIATDEEIDYDRVSYFIQFPNEIIEAAESEETEDGEDEEIDMNDYCDYPFAMEVVNGEIISLTEDFQKEITERLTEVLDMTRDELIVHLKEMSEDDESEEYELLNSCGYDALAEILGYDEVEEEFAPQGIEFLESPYGWEAKELLEGLGFALKENIEYGPHGHGTYGVVFIEANEANEAN